MSDEDLTKLDELMKSVPNPDNSFKIKCKNLLIKIKNHKKVVASGSCIFILGLVIGFLGGGGMVTPISEDEVTSAQKQDFYQYLPREGSLEEALASGHYSHCVVYTGIGLKFQGKDQQGNLVVGQSYLTYPANKAQIYPGTKVTTPLEVLKGDLGSPVKVEFKQGLQTQEAILKRVMMKKCLKKSHPDTLVQPLDF